MEVKLPALLLAAQTASTDSELAVALDVLMERHSPPKPYDYHWEVARIAGQPTHGYAWLHVPGCALSPGIDLPQLDAPDSAWEVAVAGEFRDLEAEPWRRLLNSFAVWRRRVVMRHWSNLFTINDIHYDSEWNPVTDHDDFVAAFAYALAAKRVGP